MSRKSKDRRDGVGTMKYLALLRGINVGGKAMIKMSELKAALEEKGYNDVKTYIQSGNIIFSHEKKDAISLAHDIEVTIRDHFGHNVPVLVVDQYSYKQMIEGIPKHFGTDDKWKYNLLFLIPPYEEKAIIADIGELKPDIETLTAGTGVIYQSMSIKLFGRTTSGKLAGKPIYKQMTIRNLNTGRKLLELMEA